MNDISYSKFIDGLNKAGIEINRKMLSELAISAPEEFTKIVNIAKDALNGKVSKPEVKKEEVKAVKEEKKEEKSDTLNSKTVAELKEMAKEKGVEGYTSMKKAELIDALK